MLIPIRPEQGAPAGLAATPGYGSPQPSSARLAITNLRKLLAMTDPGWAGEHTAYGWGPAVKRTFGSAYRVLAPRPNDSDFPAAQPTSSA